jgi:hypothetical protein
MYFERFFLDLLAIKKCSWGERRWILFLQLSHGKNPCFYSILKNVYLTLVKRASQESLAPKKSTFRLVNKLTNFFLAIGLQGFTKCRIPTVVIGMTWEDDLRRLSL